MLNPARYYKIWLFRNWERVQNYTKKVWSVIFFGSNHSQAYHSYFCTDDTELFLSLKLDDQRNNRRDDLVDL